VLEHHVRSSDNAPGSTPGDTSDGGCDDGSDDTTGAVHTFNTVDYSICVRSVQSHACAECRERKSGELE
jgi:hypothetical protein